MFGKFFEPPISHIFVWSNPIYQPSGEICSKSWNKVRTKSANNTSQLSNEKEPGCLGYIGGLYYPIMWELWFIINYYKDPYYNGKYEMAQLLVDSLFHAPAPLSQWLLPQHALHSGG